MYIDTVDSIICIVHAWVGCGFGAFIFCSFLITVSFEKFIVLAVPYPAHTKAGIDVNLKHQRRAIAHACY